MSEGCLPARVLEFIEARIQSVPQLEALLLLHRDPQRQWRIEELSGELHISVERAAHVLDSLAACGLAVADKAQSAFRYASAWDQSGNLMNEVALVYRRNLVQISTLIHSRSR